MSVSKSRVMSLKLTRYKLLYYVCFFNMSLKGSIVQDLWELGVQLSSREFAEHVLVTGF